MDGLDVPTDLAREDSIPSEETTGDEETTAEVKRTSWKDFMHLAVDVAETLVLSLILFGLVNLVSARIRVEGFSMLPTFQDGELVIVNKLAYQFGEAQRGDVIIFHYPRDPKEEFIKRIIGLPGDEINIRDGQVKVNGHVLSESYIAAPPSYEFVMRVPEKTLFVLGDNRNNSSDSHSWGPLPMDLVVGKAIFVYWPPQEIGSVAHPTIIAQ